MRVHYGRSPRATPGATRAVRRMRTLVGATVVAVEANVATTRPMAARRLCVPIDGRGRLVRGVPFALEFIMLGGSGFGTDCGAGAVMETSPRAQAAFCCHVSFSRSDGCVRAGLRGGREQGISAPSAPAGRNSR